MTLLFLKTPENVIPWVGEFTVVWEENLVHCFELFWEETRLQEEKKKRKTRRKRKTLKRKRRKKQQSPKRKLDNPENPDLKRRKT